MFKKRLFFLYLSTFLFCAGWEVSVEASNQEQNCEIEKLDAMSVLQKDKENFVKALKNSTYYNYSKSINEAGEDYLYLANLLSQWGMNRKIEGIPVQQLTEQLVVRLNQKTSPQKPWEKILLDIANRYIEEKKGVAIFKNQILDNIIANYNLMSFTGCKTIQQRGEDGNGKYRLLNDWGILFFHCDEEAIAYGDEKNTETKREIQIVNDDKWMETTHDYVQLWYPVFSISRHHSKAPRMSPVLFQKIKQNRDLHDIYRQSIVKLFDRTLKFMGLKYDVSDKKIIKTDLLQHINWIKNRHNFMRINRYLQALSIVDMDEERDALLEYLQSGRNNWKQFCDNDSMAMSELEAYQKSMDKYWVNAEVENKGYMSQVDESVSAANNPFFQSRTKSISKTKSTVMVGSPAQQSIGTVNSPASKQKIRKKKGQGKWQRRHVKKANRNSRKTRKKTMRREKKRRTGKRVK